MTFGPERGRLEHADGVGLNLSQGDRSDLEEPPLEEDEEVDLGGALGASAEISSQQLTLFIPSRDRLGNEIGNQRRWVLEAADLLAGVGGGFTILPPVEGGWVNDAGEVIWEHPILVYTFVKPDRFVDALPQLREFLHRLGRETNQGEVALEFDNRFFRIRAFDGSSGG